MKKFTFLFLLLLLADSLLNSFCRPVTAGTGSFPDEASLPPGKMEIPRLKPNEQVITHTAYCLSYNETHELANWVAYELTAEETHALFKRGNRFIPDPLVSTGTADDADYAGSGYDRGHLAPAGDMGWSETSMKESFYYSNMTPQVPSFNRGVWKRAEELVRSWALEYKSVYIVTGPVLAASLPTIGHDRVSVPKYFYKVVLDDHPPVVKGIGFIIPNASSKEPLQDFAVSIDSVEKLTGIDFFPLLPDDLEQRVEYKAVISAWSWVSTAAIHHPVQAGSPVQCRGITKQGKQCLNRTRNANGYCTLHQSQLSRTAASVNKMPVKRIPAGNVAVQCSGITKKGTRCRNRTYNANGRCRLHQ